MIRTLALCLFISLTAFPHGLRAHTLTIQLTGTTINKPVFVALYDKEGDFLNRERAWQKKRFDYNEKNTYRLENLPDGDYAVAVFQDLNGNKLLDENFWGSPQEPYGVSNNATARNGPPDFDECRITIDGDLTIPITLR